MTVGRWLDEAHNAAAWAAELVDDEGPPVDDLPALLAARDRSFAQLGRLAGLLRGAAWPHNSLSTALREVDNPNHSPLRQFAIGVHGAMIRLPHELSERPTAATAATRRLSEAADSLSVVGDILATHIAAGPRPSQAPFGRHTAQGAAVVAGLERDTGLGELARIAVQLIRLDHGLAVIGAEAIRAHLPAAVRNDLDTFAGSGYRRLFARLADADPTMLLRSLDPAPAVDRSAGPRAVRSLDDVVHAAASASAAIGRDPNIATIALLDAVARLGFAHTIAVSHAVGGIDNPSPRMQADALGWRRLAEAAAKVRDLRDRVAPALPAEVRHAAAWMREQVRARTDMTTGPWPDGLAQLHSTLQLICRQAIDPLRAATVRRQMVTGIVQAMDPDETRRGVHLARVVWEVAVPNDPDVRTLTEQLRDLAGESWTWPDPAAVRKAHPRSLRQARQAAAGALPSTGAAQRRPVVGLDEPTR